MQRVLDPTRIESFAQRAIPRVRLPDFSHIFTERAARLRALSPGHAVGDYLRLMAVLCEAQQDALNRLPSSPVGVSSQAHGMPLLPAVGWVRTSQWRDILTQLCGAVAAADGFPVPVAEVCRRILALPGARLEEQADLLLAATSGDIDLQAAPFVMAALQVYWTHLVSSLGFEQVAQHVATVDVPGVCPICGTLPVASIVRADQSHQGYRYLQCALCATEWHLVRIKCSHCQSTQGIHYQTLENEASQAGKAIVRAESCDQCQTYRKICYQEHDPKVEPVADDLASLALDLLMTEAGFRRASGHPLLWQTSSDG